MIDKETTVKNFVANFVQKDKRERCYSELVNPKKRNKFIDKLNHKWDSVLNMNFLNQVDKLNDSSEGIQKLLGFKDSEICYVISNYSDFDDKFMPFKEVFTEIYSRGFATLLINGSGDEMFLDTEQEKGPAPRFIGRCTKKT